MLWICDAAVCIGVSARNRTTSPIPITDRGCRPSTIKISNSLLAVKFQM
jgi:hypothetical protein